MHRLAVLAVIVVLVIAAMAAPLSAITGNWFEDFEHSYVGLVVFYDADGNFLSRCSGSLISPTKFLTAGHCADTGDGAVSARVYFQQDAGANYDPALGYDPVSGYPYTCAGRTLGSLCATSDRLYTYGYPAGFPDTHDVGLVILKQRIRGLGFAQLPSAGLLNDLATARGTKDPVFTSSGYGLTYRTQEHSAVPSISYRERLMAVSTLVNLGSALTDGYNLQLQGNGDGRGGTCSGDSGGPVFLGGLDSDQIVAVTSFGLDSLCRGTDFSYRLDRAEVLDWIANPR